VVADHQERHRRRVDDADRRGARPTASPVGQRLNPGGRVPGVLELIGGGYLERRAMAFPFWANVGRPSAAWRELRASLPAARVDDGFGLLAGNIGRCRRPMCDLRHTAGRRALGGSTEPATRATRARSGAGRKLAGMRRRLVPIAIGLAALPPTAALAAGLTIAAPRSARIGGRTIHVTARGLRPGRYALTLAAAPAPTRLTVCVARLATAANRSTSVSFTVRIPARLRCYENDSVALGSVATGPGSYHLIVGVPDGPSGFSLSSSFLRAPIRLTR
jgi:hypothetical protein